MNDIYVVLVDNNDNEVGTLEKMEAHRKALLHRAISVFIINEQGEWIIQRRAFAKYHSAGLWTNSCCTHPMPGESNQQAALRRLGEEMGMGTSGNIQFNELFSFIYKEKLDNELTEYEFDHVFIGISNELPVINVDEVCEWKAITFDALHADVLANPSHYTVWFKKIYEKVHQCIENKTNNPSFFEVGFIE